MKKIYTAPRTEVVKIQAGQMLTGSNYGMKGEVSGGEAGFQKADKDYDEDFGDLW